MSSPVISVSNLSKAYRLGTIGSSTLREDLSRAWARLLRKPDPYARVGEVQEAESGKQKAEISAFQRFNVSALPSGLFWALRDVSFEVEQGEVLGIIGANGAGKSTLLKILSRITAPTQGQVCIKGRIGSLLEVGTGFHPDLTGRENIFLNGAILGMSKGEITRNFDEIVAFSGLERFIDTPVKRYSSGMYVRLAFAVAAHLDPEILIMDEVLAVGDAAFQKKCLGKMRDVATNEGRTVLFVSHNMQAVASLCSRGILLDAGQVANNGDVNTVVNQYLTMVVRSTSRQREQIWDASDLAAPGNDKIRLRRTAIVPETGPVDSLIDMNTAFRIEVEYWNLVEGSSLILTLSLFALDGSPVFECSTTKEPHWNGKSFPRGLFRSVCFIPADLMNEGSYRIRLHFVTDQLVGVYTCSEAATVSISDSRPRHTSYYGRFIGNVHPHLAWQTALLEKTNNLEFAAKQTK